MRSQYGAWQFNIEYTGEQDAVQGRDWSFKQQLHHTYLHTLYVQTCTELKKIAENRRQSGNMDR